MKKCKNCNNDFEPKGNKGSEQVYCSIDCRQKAGIERYKQRLINSNNNNYDKTTNTTGTTNFKRNYEDEIGTILVDSNKGMPNYNGSNQTMLGMDNRAELTGNYGRIECDYSNPNFLEYIGLIRENANLRAEVKLLTEKVTNLEAELLEYELENDMEEEEQPGILGNIMNAYKQDPTTTVLFAKDMILEFLKPKQQTAPKTQ